MIGQALGILARLSRLESSGLVFFTIAIPVYYRTGDLKFALMYGLPILAICMCGFIINDLSDIDRDRENHPDRPLPAEHLSETQASLLYFGLLALALITIKAFIEPFVGYFYLLLLIALINYNYVVAYFPAIKNFYVAIVGAIPLLILALLIGKNGVHWTAMIALFLFLFGREILMDVEDMKGDGRTLIKILGEKVGTRIAFSLKAVAAIALLTTATTAAPIAAACIILSLDVIFAVLWRKKRLRRSIIHATKIQLLAGILIVALT